MGVCDGCQCGDELERLRATSRADAELIAHLVSQLIEAQGLPWRADNFAHLPKSVTQKLSGPQAVQELSPETP